MFHWRIKRDSLEDVDIGFAYFEQMIRLAHGDEELMLFGCNVKNG
ncbi:hypothetical protein C2W64_00241 [Brevibacillus laterosporus]|nr:hypothetical protein C2W64_00241 [Brevibacillus laterosporus]